MKTKEEPEKIIKDTITKYNKIIFGPDSLVCMACLNELRNQQIIDKKVYYQKLMDDTMMDGDVMIDGRTGEVLDPEVDFT